jgi:acyl-CoA thioester hydrolase
MFSENDPWDFFTELEVRDYELDSQGIVNNATYLNYFEHCRHRFLRARGIDFIKLQAQGVDPVVAEVHIRYFQSLRSGDQFRIQLRWKAKGRVRYIFDQEILRLPDLVPIAHGVFTVATLVNGKPGYFQL